MGYQRAGWHSGLTYRQECELCHTVVQYTDKVLGFRPWYADGFVYCPTCKKPLRHNEAYAINGKSTTTHVAQTAVDSPKKEIPPEQADGFCAQCGKAFHKGDRFCAGCGAKRD